MKESSASSSSPHRRTQTLPLPLHPFGRCRYRGKETNGATQTGTTLPLPLHSFGRRRYRRQEVKLPRPTRVKNKTPAPIQITAEQILREAPERQKVEICPPKQKITDASELADYRLRKRKEFEDLIRRVRWNINVWIKYAQWEESQKDFNRARSVWVRALEVDYRNHTLWLKYAEVEMKNKFINHACNVWNHTLCFLEV
uniref:Pre-mRNA-splicing factor Syf1/CRNKL1-like C-terminal HAT-repeats domain-containing protein n=1 Tax=Fagus sylvatica TaxID=28930 RepID=A0A2N9I3A3_FAGSY